MKIETSGLELSTPATTAHPTQAPSNNTESWNTTLAQYQVDEEVAPPSTTTEIPAEAQNTQNPIIATLTETEREIRFSLLKELMKIGDDAQDKEVAETYAEDHILYPTEEGTEPAIVDPYWNAENTGQRLVDFALSFRSHFSDMNDVEYLEEVRAAMLEGFARAKEDMGFSDESIPPDLAQLYNDTFRSTMEKLDTLLATAKQGESIGESVSIKSTTIQIN
ncbi:MAG: hypothetical protein OCD76_05145 [Reichenbachiella sp.]